MPAFWGDKDDAPTPPSFGAEIDRERKARILMHTTEVESTMGMFRTLGDVCFEKCIQSYKTNQLTPNEEKCSDNCALKFIETFKGPITEKLFAAQSKTTQ